MRPLDSGALACTEFWLNRYQTLFTGLFALAAAIIAWNALSAARQQSAAAIKQATLSSSEYWERRLARLQEMKRLCEAITSEGPHLKRLASLYEAEANEDDLAAYERFKSYADALQPILSSFPLRDQSNCATRYSVVLVQVKAAIERSLPWKGRLDEDQAQHRTAQSIVIIRDLNDTEFQRILTIEEARIINIIDGLQPIVDPAQNCS